MSSLETQIRQLAELADETMPWLDLSEIQNPERVRELPPLQPSPIRTRTRPWVAIGVAAVAVVVLTTLPLLFRATQLDSPPATEPSLSTIATDTTPTTASGPNDEERFTIDWVPAIWAGAAPTWITEYPSGGFVAGALGHPARFSSDGVTWTTEPFDDSLEGYRDLYVEGRFALANARPLHAERRVLTFNDWERAWVPGQAHAPDVVWEVVLEYIDGGWRQIDVAGHVWEIPVQLGDTIIVFPRRDGVGTSHPEYDLFDGSSGSWQYVASLPLPTLDEGYNARPQFAAIPGGFALYDDLGRFHTSPDGVTWADQSTARPDYTESNRRIQVINLIRQGEDLFAQPYTDRELWHSQNGRSWSQWQEPWVTVETQPRVLHGASDYLVLTTLVGEVPGSTFIATSPDGSSWLKAANPPPYDTTRTDSNDPIHPNAVFEVAHDTVFFIQTKPDGSTSIHLGPLS